MSERDEDHGAGPSWDTERADAPERPTFVSSLSEDPLIERPRPLSIAMIAASAAAIAFIAVIILAFRELDEIRATLLSVIPEDLEEEYAEDDTELAVNVLLGALGGLGALFTLLQLLAARSLMAHQNPSARVFFIIVTVLYAPVAFMMSALAGLAPLMNTLLGAGVIALLIAAVLMCLPRVSAWLRQRDQRRSTPFTSFQQTDDAAPR